MSTRPPKYAMMAVALALMAAPVATGQSAAIDPLQTVCQASLDGQAAADGSIEIQYETQYEATLYRVQGNASTPLADVQGNGTFVDGDVEAGVTYTYQIRLALAGDGSPPCDSVTVTAQAAADASGDAGNGTASGDAASTGEANGNATGQGHGNATGQSHGNASAEGHGNASTSADAHGNASAGAYASASVAATLAACPASISAHAAGDGTIQVATNASADVDHVIITRIAGGNASETAAAAGETVIDTDTRVGATYTYQIAVVVDGERSETCDAIEVTSVPSLPGAAAGLALTGAAVLGYLGWRRFRQ